MKWNWNNRHPKGNSNVKIMLFSLFLHQLKVFFGPSTKQLINQLCFLHFLRWEVLICLVKSTSGSQKITASADRDERKKWNFLLLLLNKLGSSNQLKTLYGRKLKWPDSRLFNSVYFGSSVFTTFDIWQFYVSWTTS